MIRYCQTVSTLVVLSAVSLSTGRPLIAADEKVSRPGEYKGYSDAAYSESEMTSQYVAVRDGTKLAVDIIRPKQAGKVVEIPLPVVWMHTPYNRRNYRGGLAAEKYPGFAAELVKFGYVVAVADFRGLFASNGANGAYNRGEWLDAAYWDAYDITEWLAKQPWSNGKIGMWGCSATGGSQMQAASSAPPHLKAIFPMSCEFDVFPFGVRGGISPADRPTSVAPNNGGGPNRDRAAVKVDADTDGSLLKAAVAGHQHNIENAGLVPFRNSVSPTLNVSWWEKSSPSTYLKQMKAANVAVYAAANWDEGATKYGAFFTFNNLDNAKLIVGPLGHCAWLSTREQFGFDLVVEEHRFFDYWLKGIDNGVMREPAVYYFTYNAPAGKEWQSATKWPLPNEARVKYYLAPESALGTTAPTVTDAKDSVKVDYEVSAQNRSEKGLVYSTPPLASDTQLTGHPVIHLWASSTAADGDFIANLEDVSPDGKAVSYNMDGRLRASLRAVHEPPFNNLGLPWHRSNKEDAKPLTPGEPVELVFDLFPISYIFKAGHRMRLTLNFADGRATPKVDPAPTVSIYRDAARKSYLELPIIKN